MVYLITSHSWLWRGSYMEAVEYGQVQTPRRATNGWDSVLPTCLDNLLPSDASIPSVRSAFSLRLIKAGPLLGTRMQDSSRA